MRVLLAIDGSECSRVAVELVAGLDWPAKAKLYRGEAVSSGVAVLGEPWPPTLILGLTGIAAGIYLVNR